MKNIIFTVILSFVMMFSAEAQTFNDSDKFCLAKAIYFEARGQTEQGQTAIANVILNRVNDPLYPKTVCDVIYQPKQFSWHRKGFEYDPNTKTDNHIKVTWNNIKTLANNVLSVYNTNKYNDYTHGAVNFHAVYVNPHWKNVTPTVTIGGHIFYKRKSNEI